MSTTGGLNSLTTLIKRLEAATSRLEDIATSTQSSVEPYDQAKGATPSQGQSSANGDEKPRHPSASSVVLPATVVAFDSILDDDLKPFAELSTELNGIIAEQGAAFCVAFKAQRDVLLIASKAREPSPSSPVFKEILKDLQHGIETVNNVRENNRRCPQENHLAMLADGVGMLAWVTIKPGPDNFVGDVLGGAQVYGNKILMQFKDKEPQNVQWVRSFVKLAGALKTFIKQHFAAGLEWNSSGIDAEQALKEVGPGNPTESSRAALEASRGSAPPPPPPPLPAFDAGAPTPPSLASGAAKAAGVGEMGSIFDQLNRGETVTAGLRKVDKSQMTHKNPELRGSSIVSSSSDSKSSASSTAAKTPTQSSRPPRRELDGNKWSIENYENIKSPIEIEVERQHSVLITRCNSTTIRINGKANAVSIDGCNRLDLIVDSLVSSVSVVGSNNFRMQVLGSLPSVELDKVDGATIYLSQDSLEAEVYTSKCSSVNITLPPARQQDDSVEVPVPEQIRSWVENGRLLSEIVKQEG